MDAAARNKEATEKNKMVNKQSFGIISIWVARAGTFDGLAS